MPNVMGREFPYTPEGIAAAERYRQAVGMRNGGMMGFRPLGYADGDLVEGYTYPDKLSRQAAINFIAEMTEAGDATVADLLTRSDAEVRRAEMEVRRRAEAGEYDHVFRESPPAYESIMNRWNRLFGRGVEVPTSPAVNPREKVYRDALEAGSFPEFQRRQPTMGVSEQGWRALQGGRTITEEDPELLGTPAYQLKDFNKAPPMTDEQFRTLFQTWYGRLNPPLSDRPADRDIEDLRGMRNGGIMTLRRY